MAKTWSLYVVKLREEARERVLGRMRPLARSRIDRRFPLVYVGVTALTPEERYARHREGGMTSAPIVRDYGVGLLESLYRDRNPLPAKTEKEALEEEAALAEELRDRGYAVWGEHGKPLTLGPKDWDDA
ncbi:MAG: hypothetical protein ACRDH8_08300 [Actinomycetota bacterium]